METEKLDKETVKRILNMMEEEFKKEISHKTGWGKNEVLIVLEKAKTNTLLRLFQ